MLAIDTQRRRWDPLDALQVSLETSPEAQVGELRRLYALAAAADDSATKSLEASSRTATTSTPGS